MRTRAIVMMLVSITALLAQAAPPKQRDNPPKIERTEKKIEGWRTLFDRRLLSGEHAELGRRAERLLTANLYELSEIMPAAALEKLRAVTITVDLDHGKLTSMQYHPSAGWLKDNGYAEALAKQVHIPVAAGFVDLHHRRVQPWCVLHELAHAYHDQFLSFDNPEIVAAYDAAKAAGIYEQVLFIQGNTTKHYALTNHKEYFAELSESYIGTNDFHPFVRGELKRHDPRAYELLEKVWGRLP
jgi:hypothetical protein